MKPRLIKRVLNKLVEEPTRGPGRRRDDYLAAGPNRRGGERAVELVGNIARFIDDQEGRRPPWTRLLIGGNHFQNGAVPQLDPTLRGDNMLSPPRLGVTQLEHPFE